MAKQYGLIQSNKYKNQAVQPVSRLKPSIFNDDDDDDSDSGPTASRPTGISTSLKRQDRMLQARAVEEDPTVYQYDELYDDMESKRKESKLARKDVDRKPKYIGKLLASADKRKRENERRIERQVQKEREAEGDEFKDKESFVTASYRAKLEEMRKLDEEEKRQEYLESIGDVTKQGNLDGFYRHLFEQKGLKDDAVKEEKDKEEEESKDTNEEDNEVEPTKVQSLKANKRKYRRRDESSSESDVENDQAKSDRPVLQHLPSNLDADSDFSIDSSDSEEEAEKVDKPESPKEEKMKETQEVAKVDDKVSTENVPADVDVAGKEDNSKETEVPVVKKPRIDIWKKRTIDEVFDEALKRYFERKSLREAGMYVRPV